MTDSYQALPAVELDKAHDHLFNHADVGPFNWRQLIQRMVTSHPSRDYVYRVVQKFNNNGAGMRGDRQAVITTILLDYEGRSVGSTSASMKPTYGQQREALMQVTAATRAFHQTASSGTCSQSNSHVITVTTPNKYAAGNSVFLEFAGGRGGVIPSAEVYTVLATLAPSVAAFSVNAKG